MFRVWCFDVRVEAERTEHGEVGILEEGEQFNHQPREVRVPGPRRARIQGSYHSTGLRVMKRESEESLV